MRAHVHAHGTNLSAAAPVGRKRHRMHVNAHWRLLMSQCEVTVKISFNKKKLERKIISFKSLSNWWILGKQFMTDLFRIVKPLLKGDYQIQLFINTYNNILCICLLTIFIFSDLNNLFSNYQTWHTFIINCLSIEWFF